ncbi:sensor histidine kinase [Paenibacillus radicis (ex Xue et al. 2023)]|uniref:histidine kinase n=1 Tax=Paenibacillus radicis (ex Xue et al. 2023) TaxID=2972489 RepID=A0ABT1YFU2_9BACL|nr:histidine kinase [Paenibacillus radicis (ex Xue et al. 2023)]MCR8632065.1 histidine kinase [Paenibacillus radicis (ex Xue et al. 2023)]
MLYKNIKSLILIIPTLTIGLWEYVRHTFLLPYISMELGNWLAPLLVFVVTMTLLRKLFWMLEVLQEMLQQERSDKAALMEREKISRELHDGIAQSLFLLSVKVDQMEQGNEKRKEPLNSFRKTVHQVNEYVRHAIASLRYPPVADSKPWGESIHNLVLDFKKDTGIAAELNWQLREERLSLKEKVELYATLREALINVYKHANARHAWVIGEEEADGWRCKVTDDGTGIQVDSMANPKGFGITIMKERAQEMGWFLAFKQESSGTTVEVGRRG